MAGKGKTLPGETRKLVFGLIQFALREKESKQPVIEMHKAMDRVSAMTGISRDTLSRIKKEGAVNNGEWKTPYTKRTGRPKKVVLDDTLKTVIKNKIQDFRSRNEVPTLRKLLKVLKMDNNFAASVDTLRRVLKEMGFKYTTASDSKKKVLTECCSGDKNDKKSKAAGKPLQSASKPEEKDNGCIPERNFNAHSRSYQPFQPSYDHLSELMSYGPPFDGRPISNYNDSVAIATMDTSRFIFRGIPPEKCLPE